MGSAQMLDSQQLQVLFWFSLLMLYAFMANRRDKAVDEAFRKGYERGMTDGRIIRTRAQ